MDNQMGISEELYNKMLRYLEENPKTGRVVLSREFEVPDSIARKIVSEFKTPLGDGPAWSHPAISDGRLYVRRGAALMVYDIKNN